MDHPKIERKFRWFSNLTSASKENAARCATVISTGAGHAVLSAGWHVNGLRDMVTIEKIITIDVHFELICSPGGSRNVLSIFPQE